MGVFSQIPERGLRPDDDAPAFTGLRIVPGYLDREAQDRVLAAVREIVAKAPLYTPRMPRSGQPRCRCA